MNLVPLSLQIPEPSAFLGDMVPVGQSRAVEWVLVLVLLALALVPVGRKLRFHGAWIVILAAVIATAAGALLWQGRLAKKAVSKEQLLQKTPRQGRPGGYVGSDSCQACHPAQHASWHRSFHRTMTQHAVPHTVRGDFNDVKLELDGEAYHLQRRGDEFWVEMTDPDWTYMAAMKRTAAHDPRVAALPAIQPKPPRTSQRIGMTTGSHHMQAYWVWSKFGNLQYSFPFTFLFEENRWVPRNDVFLLKPNAPHVQQVWNMTCINCHSTAGQSRQHPQTKLFETRAAELGISCESCHGPAGEHVRLNSDPARRYALHRQDQPDPTIVNPVRQGHVQSSQTCGQCHAIRYNSHPAEWNLEGVRFQPGGDIEANAPLAQYEELDASQPDSPERQKRRAMLAGSFWSDGLVRVSGREFNGMAESGCFKRGELSCISCHSMHQYTDTDDQLAVNREGNNACLQCHGAYAAKLEQHTHHRSGSSGSLCYNCHMPHTSYGLLKAIRSHTIHSPSVKATLQTGRPNACNLCHLDRSLDWTSRKLHEWYGAPMEPLTGEQRSTSAAVQGMLSGDAGLRALLAWHAGWEPAKRTAGTDWLAPYLASLLADPYSVVRYIAGRSLKRLPGFESFAYDYIGPAEERTGARERALEIWRARTKPLAGARPSLLLEADGTLWEEKFGELLKQRDDRAMELFE